jgi:hypothetical protein
MKDDGRDQDAPEIVYTGATEFEANAVAASLRAQGFDAMVVATAQSAIPVPGVQRMGVPVFVRRGERERAAAAIRQNKADSVDIDWSEVDVGEMEDGAPGVTPSVEPRAQGFGPGFRAIRNTGIVLVSIAALAWVLPAKYAVPAAALALLLWGVSLFDQEAVARARSRRNG